MQPQIPIDQEKIKAFCEKWKIVEFSLFGSVLTENFRPDSDVDVMVEFVEPTLWSLYDLDVMEDELSEIIGKKVDLFTKLSVEYMQNRIRKRSILEGAQVFYAV